MVVDKQQNTTFVIVIAISLDRNMKNKEHE